MEKNSKKINGKTYHKEFFLKTRDGIEIRATCGECSYCYLNLKNGFYHCGIDNAYIEDPNKTCWQFYPI